MGNVTSVSLEVKSTSRESVYDANSVSGVILPGSKVTAVAYLQNAEVDLEVNTTKKVGFPKDCLPVALAAATSGSKLKLTGWTYASVEKGNYTSNFRGKVTHDSRLSIDSESANNQYKYEYSCELIK